MGASGGLPRPEPRLTRMLSKYLESSFMTREYVPI
jgi:hypothetical protein